MFNAPWAESQATEVGDKWLPQMQQQAMKQKQNQKFRQYEKGSVKLLVDSYLETQISPEFSTCHRTKRANIPGLSHSNYSASNTEAAG